MAYRKTHRRKFQYSQVVPIWTTTQSDLVTLAFQALLSKLGITDAASYFKKLRIPIAISVIVCACMGAYGWGAPGILLGALVGLLAPAALLWLAVLLVGVAIFLGIYFAAWALIWAIAKWVLTEFFRL